MKTVSFFLFLSLFPPHIRIFPYFHHGIRQRAKINEEKRDEQSKKYIGKSITYAVYDGRVSLLLHLHKESGWLLEQMSPAHNAKPFQRNTRAFNVDGNGEVKRSIKRIAHAFLSRKGRQGDQWCLAESEFFFFSFYGISWYCGTKYTQAFFEVDSLPL